MSRSTLVILERPYPVSAVRTPHHSVHVCVHAPQCFACMCIPSFCGSLCTHPTVFRVYVHPNIPWTPAHPPSVFRVYVHPAGPCTHSTVLRVYVNPVILWTPEHAARSVSGVCTPHHSMDIRARTPQCFGCTYTRDACAYTPQCFVCFSACELQRCRSTCIYSFFR